MTKVTMPPVSVIVESGYELRWVGAEPLAQLVARTGAKPGSVFITTNQAEAYADARVREALEQIEQSLEGLYTEALNARVSEDEDDEAWNLTCLARAQSISQAQQSVRTLIRQHDNE